MPNIRAIELGFGTTSLTESISSAGVPKIKTFTSFVSKVDTSKQGLGAGLSNRDTVKVEIDDSVYEIGTDAHLAADSSSTRVLNSSYVESKQYKALLFGSLLYMDCTEIDLLVLALPVEHWVSKRMALAELVKGEHEIGGVKYNIKDVWVITQPMGGLLYHANSVGQDGFNELKNLNILSIDPGFGTYDYIVSRGLKLNESRCSGSDLGMNKVLSACSNALRSAFPSLSEFPMELIDEAFYKNKGIIRISGNKYPFPKCSGKDAANESTTVNFDVQPEIDRVTKNAVTNMKNIVGDGGDIDIVIMMGGVVDVYYKSVQESYPLHKIIVLENAITAICIGMYLGGLQYYQAISKAKKNV